VGAKPPEYPSAEAIDAAKTKTMPKTAPKSGRAPAARERK
jgi:hypothetical protein